MPKIEMYLIAREHAGALASDLIAAADNNASGMGAHLPALGLYRIKVAVEADEADLTGNMIALEEALEAIEVDKDHLHLLIRYRPALFLSAIISRIKGGSSRAIRLQHMPAVQQMLWGDHFWSPSYCAISCGGAPIETIRQYIENQGNEPCPLLKRRGWQIENAQLHKIAKKEQTPRHRIELEAAYSSILLRKL